MKIESMMVKERRHTKRRAFCLLVLAGLLAGWMPSLSASGADHRVDIPVGQASGPPLSEGHPTPRTPPVAPPDAKPVTYECPRTKYINCMPPLQGKARVLCLPEYLEWVRDHCPGVEVVY